MSQDDLNRQAFREEAQDLLSELESALLELDENPDDRELVDRVFRALHTVKGSGAMFGFDDIAAFTHDVENVFDLVRNNEIPLQKEILDLALASRDRILEMMEGSDTGVDNNPEKSEQILVELRKFIPGKEESSAVESEAPPIEEDLDERLFHIRFKPVREFFFTGSSPLSVIDELMELGEAQIIAHIEDVPPLDKIEPEQCYIWWDVILKTRRSREAVMDVFIFVEDDAEIAVKAVEADVDVEGDYKKLGEILVDRGDVDAEFVDQILRGRKRLGEILAETGIVSEAQVQAALAEQSAVKELKTARSKTDTVSSIRVAADKLDKLVNLVGELVTVQAQISQTANSKGDPALSGLAEELERLSDELRDSTLGIRMLPIGSTFSKFRRLVRDLSGDLGKEIDLETEGAETELDKTVIERLNDPLVHILRNSIDHGVESPEVRIAAGKSKKGRIRLSAKHSGGNVLIRVDDDGKGIDAEVIRAKAVEKGLISADAELTPNECYGLIFAAGFSTAAKITNVSGRGVGMDVVKRSIEELRGNITVDSQLGVGTSITIKLPLTLAIIDGLQVKVGEEAYVLPLSLVEECVELSTRMENAGREQSIINLRGEIVPFIRLREIFEVPGESPPIEQVVITSIEGSRVGVVVDFVVGEHQTVIKSLGRIYRGVEGVSGATIQGDGSMALILDVPRLVRVVERSQM